MPQILKHRKIKRATVLLKRSQCMRSFPRKSYKPLCDKLKSNNNSLAQALSKQKQESQLLFAQNVALVSEVQNLGLACSKRDAVITNVLKNAKEMLKILVTATGYLTNTISSCQEFAASCNSNVQMSCNTAGEKESLRRLSTKSPARGVVKPMVSGHTITKPTINLSRINMQHIYNAPNLSIIHEVSTTPTRNQETNSPRSSVAVSIRQRNHETGRMCRIPERMTVASPRVSEENERRLSKRSIRHSGSMTGKRSRSKSGRFSGNVSTRCSVENVECIGSPRVKLNDVSKLLRNSQSINIRMLTEKQDQNDRMNDNQNKNSDDSNQDVSQTSVMIPESPPTDSSKRDSEMISRNTEEEEEDQQHEQESENEPSNATNVRNTGISDWYDPLEGPSWLLANPQAVPCFTNTTAKTDGNFFDDNINVSRAHTSNDALLNTTYPQRSSPLPMLAKCANYEHNSKKNKLGGQENEYNGVDASMKKRDDNGYAGDTSTTSDAANSDENECKEERKRTVNVENFITQRGRYVDSEDEDDFTLMYMRQPRNMDFDLNDLKVPVLDTSVIKPLIVNEPEPELTTNVQKITQVCPLPSSMENNSINMTTFNEATVRLPSILSNDYEKDVTLQKVKQQRKQKIKKSNLKVSVDYVERTLMVDEQESQPKKNKKKSTNNKDPSAVKVVLQKLNESDVRTRTQFSEEICPQDSHSSILNPALLCRDSNRNSSDSESSNASMNSTYTTNRPRRKGAPLNLHEPSLRKKLRRDF